MNNNCQNLSQNLNIKPNIQNDGLTDIHEGQSLHFWHEISTSQPQNLCIHQMFEHQVKRSPDAIAVKLENQYLTYRQLNQKANQLAHHLRKLGVGPEVLVSICVERSLEMVVGLLGILKAGGAYVPLDPNYPSERLAFILADTKTPFILTQGKLVSQLPPHQAKVICLDSEWEKIAANSQENPVCTTTIDNLIYTIYTSGSTGKPKGVMIPHQGILNQLLWRQETFKLNANDKVLQTISFSFDPSVWQIFWPLCCGAQLILARPGGHQDPSYLVQVIAKQKITVIALVPSLLRVLLEEPSIKNCRCLRHIFCGGEPLPIELIEYFFERLNLNHVLHNCYGPTEASIDATFWTCQRQIKYTTAPIGRPITNTQIYILNENLQHVSTGEIGELHIGGISLARGYLNRPDLTQQKFIPNPFNHKNSSRLYKTGDLVRYLPDGNIEFIGRVDQQVKIRGFRIELGEIETVLNQHSGVSQSVVIAKKDKIGNNQLLAYVVPHQQQIPNSIQIRRFVQGKLPEYMVPSRFIFLDQLPLNPNGKIDRQALHDTNLSTPELETKFVAPQNEIERQITQIWEEILGIQPIGIKDNFFDLGGNSLLAVKMFWQIENRLGTNLPLATLLQSGTIEALSAIISKKYYPKNRSLVAIQPHGSRPPFFCVHGMGGEVLCFRDLALRLGDDQPFYGLQPKGLDAIETPYTRIEDMASHYLQEIRTIQPQGPYFLGGFSFGGLVVLEMAQQLHQQGEEVEKLVIFDTCLPGCSQRSPFWKRIILHLDNAIQQGPNYLLHKTTSWGLLVKTYFQDRYKRYLPITKDLPETERYLKIVDANYQAKNDYKFQTYPGRITLFRTEDKHRYDVVGMEYDPQFGWGNLAMGGVDVHYVPGSHFSLFEEPHVQIMAEKLRSVLG
ncbi:amino acid adenylation domain protein [Richelia sinica FACHB-800]|uniref:Amino acid adenylation domain protein n=1 Tax=Richelia sinica FACHB-800 TaxID=1357546 RepID=A0A975T9B9_9NOST|nr:amino acid adenylation domain-containing protein [Richelia sinica]QXE24305.1 amino acid adenylation domain protein [Richelia sinica FACHB-800]